MTKCKSNCKFTGFYSYRILSDRKLGSTQRFFIYARFGFPYSKSALYAVGAGSGDGVSGP
ncbi:hypothetical protein PRABACTJOHN_03616 [Parabacteroides johnsonii DSM 18315]|uniref:Uncharacterized protein n=1 Tax=Parabacteroides johnsonii DSM 18315 TaxID=537006 RepID=B7BEY7_9BACT|nr:hypothetical protein PRABACTJOHN_03616 [Parabacteroides johnsonii DSM 18315]